MSEFKALLISPPLDNMVEMEMSKNLVSAMGSYPPLGLLYIATYLKKFADFKVQIGIIDCPTGKIDYRELTRRIKEYAPDMIGVTACTPTIADTILTTRLAKEINPEVITVVGGHHIYCYPEETLLEDSIDFIIKGEGEVSFLKLASSLLHKYPLYDIDGIGFNDNGAIYLNEKSAFIDDLNSLPFPDRDMLPRNGYRCSVGSQNRVATLISSRGCPHECTFCYSPQKVYRSRSTENVLSEIKYLVGLGFNEFFFFDELFNATTDRVIDIAEAIISENLRIKWSFRGRVDNITQEMLKISKRSGCSRIHFGIETSSDAALKILNKKTSIGMISSSVELTRRNKIITVGNFMIGLPEESKEQIMQAFDFARKLRFDYIEIGIFTAYPHTKLYNERIEKGLKGRDIWREFAKDPFGDYKALIPPICSDRLNRKDLESLMKSGYLRYYFDPAYILRSLARVENCRELLNKIRGAYFLCNEFINKEPS